MLVGLGGLYGASSLVGGRKAEAKPLQPPDLSVCDHKGATTSDRKIGVVRLDADCCPPYDGNDPQEFYVPPPVDRLRKRPAAHRMTPQYLTDYKLAIQKMKELDSKEPDNPHGFMQQANIHCAYCNGPYDQRGLKDLDIQVHNSWLFFPFHRWYLYFFERICGKLIGKPDFALPYWNWDHQDGMYMPAAFTEPYSPLYDCNRDQTHWGSALVDLDLLGDGVSVEANLKQMQQEMIIQADTALKFMGSEYRAGFPPPGIASGGTSERGSHIGIHVWTGNPQNRFRENMGNFYSAGRDPIFYSHHANVDRMWSIWSRLHPTVEPITDPDFLDASFLFYDEQKNLVKVRVRDCLHHKSMGYDYEHSNIKPWVDYVPRKREFPANVKELAKTAKTPEETFPATLTETIRVIVDKPAKGKADEVLVIEGIKTEVSQLVGFDVYVNYDEHSTDAPVAPERVGGLTQIPHRSKTTETPSDLELNLMQLYNNINIDDDDDIVVVTSFPASMVRLSPLVGSRSNPMMRLSPLIKIKIPPHSSFADLSQFVINQPLLFQVKCFQ